MIAGLTDWTMTTASSLDGDGIMLASLPPFPSRLVKRRVVQIAVLPSRVDRGWLGRIVRRVPGYVFALCSDGSLWQIKADRKPGSDWEEVSTPPARHVIAKPRSKKRPSRSSRSSKTGGANG